MECVINSCNYTCPTTSYSSVPLAWRCDLHRSSRTWTGSACRSLECASRSLQGCPHCPDRRCCPTQRSTSTHPWCSHTRHAESKSRFLLWHPDAQRSFNVEPPTATIDPEIVEIDETRSDQVGRPANVSRKAFTNDETPS